jgi:ribosome-associated protein
MNAEEIKLRIPAGELRISNTRSSGPGGQNVNKVNTKVELRFNVAASSFLTEKEKEIIFLKLKKRINSEGYLIVTSQSERSQLMNRKKAEEKFFKLLASALTVKKKRKETKPTEASKKKRIENKKKHGSVKKLRGKSSVSEIE